MHEIPSSRQQQKTELNDRLKNKIFRTSLKIFLSSRMLALIIRLVMVEQLKRW